MSEADAKAVEEFMEATRLLHAAQQEQARIVAEADKRYSKARDALHAIALKKG